MARRYTGGFLSAKEQVTDTNTANGVFTLAEAQEKTALGNFPTGRWTPQRSLRFRSSASAYLSRTPTTAGNRTTWTWSGWVKRGAIGAVDCALFYAGTGANESVDLSFSANNAGDGLYFRARTGGVNQYALQTTVPLFRDPAAWYHIVCAVDTTQATSSERVKIYVNGALITTYSTNTIGAQNYSTYMNSTVAHYNGSINGGSFFDGYMAEVNFIDGQQLSPSYFGATDPETGTWIPKRYTGTYGTNGFYLPFDNNSSFYSAYFDGSGDYIQSSAYNSNLDLNSGDWTIDFWVNPAAPTGTYKTIASFGPDSSNNFGCILFDNGTNYAVQVSYIQAGVNYAFNSYPSSYDIAPNQWSHVVCQRSGNNIYIYVNGVLRRYHLNAGANVTAVGSGVWNFGQRAFDGGQQMKGYISNFRLIKGQALYSASNTTVGTAYFTPSWKPTTTTSDGATASNVKLLTLQSSTLTDNSATGLSMTAYGNTALVQNSPWGSGLAEDGSGKNNSWSLNNFSFTNGVTYDSMVDVPGIPAVSVQTDVGGVVRGNYCTLNPLNRSSQISGNISQANLYVYNGSGWPGISGTIAVNSGKWYYECTVTGHTTNTSGIVGWCLASMPQDSDISNYIPQQGGFYVRNDTSGAKQKALNFSSTVDLISGAYGNGLVQIAVDFDNGKMWIGKDGAWITGNPSTGDTPAFSFAVNTSAGYTPFIGPARNDIAQQTYTCNFGQRPFTYTPPTGFKSLNTTNLPNPVIKRPVEHFDTKVYTGTNQGLFIGNTTKPSTGYQISSAKFSSNSFSHLRRLIASNGNAQKFTISMWFKRSWLGNPTGYDEMLFGVGTPWSSIAQASEMICTIQNDYLYLNGGTSGVAGTFSYTSKPIFKDSDWHHLTVAFDTTKTDSTARIKVYVDGLLLTPASAAYPAQNISLYANTSGYYHTIGSGNFGGGGTSANNKFFDGSIGEFYLIDGQALDSSNFGDFDSNGVWRPRQYTGTYGTNGCYISFADSRSPDAIALDYSGNNNHHEAYGLHVISNAKNAPNVLSYNNPGTYTWTAPAGVTSVNYLVVGGGGGGSVGGGGGGGVLSGTLSVTPGTGYTVTVGSGGTGNTSGTAASSVFASITALGGANGIYPYDTGPRTTGASGGGGGVGKRSDGLTWGPTSGGYGTVGQGNAGGNAVTPSNPPSSSFAVGAGGGGAGAAGSSNGGNGNWSGGNGGIGITNSITGVATYYGGGGGGSTPGNTLGGFFPSRHGLGGRGGGGFGYGGESLGSPGTNGLGGGGGGGGYNGGSGVVILSYSNAASYSDTNVNKYYLQNNTVDTPTMGNVSNNTTDVGLTIAGNYPNWVTHGSATPSNGGTTVSCTDQYATITNMGATKGKWYWEVRWDSGSYYRIGVASEQGAKQDLGGTAFSWSKLNNTARVYYNGSSSSYGSDGSVGDFYQIAMDLDKGMIWYGINGTWQASGDPANGLNPSQVINNVLTSFSTPKRYYPALASGSGTAVYSTNFGQIPFRYTPPAGFKSLNSKNLADVADFTTNNVNSPDLVWIKSRSIGGNHSWFDSVRGPTKHLSSSASWASETPTDGTGLITFNPNGFTLGVDLAGTTGGETNGAGYSLVAWQWNRGKVPGFDIVNYSGTGTGGRQVPHNLGATPKLIIVKQTTAASTNYGWIVQHASLGPTKSLILNGGNAAITSTGMWNDTSPSSTSFTVGNDYDVNRAGYGYIAYLWAEVPGFSKFGSYVGNGSADGPFIHTGFKPKWILIKNATNAGAYNWRIFDSVRTGFNGGSGQLILANLTNAELAEYDVDFLSNGFKVRNSAAYPNGSGDTIVYIAFAENPFKYVNAR